MKNLDVVKKRVKRPKFDYEAYCVRKALKRFKYKKKKPNVLIDDLTMLPDRLRVKLIK